MHTAIHQPDLYPQLFRYKVTRFSSITHSFALIISKYFAHPCDCNIASVLEKVGLPMLAVKENGSYVLFRVIHKITAFSCLKIYKNSVSFLFEGNHASLHLKNKQNFKGMTQKEEHIEESASLNERILAMPDDSVLFRSDFPEYHSEFVG